MEVTKTKFYESDNLSNVIDQEPATIQEDVEHYVILDKLIEIPYLEARPVDFKDKLKEVDEAIEECSFMAIDCEFTGLNHAGLSTSALFDVPEERYSKLVEGALDFLVIQFGLCTFSYDGNTKQYTAKPFNFYTFPRPLSRVAPDVRFACQSSSLDFLISQGFDFNKMFREGIPYLQPSDEAKLKDAVEKKNQLFCSPAMFQASGGSYMGGAKGPVSIPPEHAEFIDMICKQVDKFLESGEEDTLKLDPCTAYQRKLTYQKLESKYGGELYLRTQTTEKKQRFIVVTRVKEENDIKKLEQEKLNQDLAAIDEAVGFTHVIKKISQSGKLVVAHNMLLDITHTIHQFLYKLPKDYQEFKSLCRCVFPRLIDTKLMAATQPFKDKIDNSSLGALSIASEFPPFTKPDVVLGEGFDNRYLENDAHHEAGFDAFITGKAFISLSNYLGTCQSPSSGRITPTSALLEPFMNKIYMMRSMDVPYMDLAGPDLTPCRDHVFHVTFPPDWRGSDINQLFSVLSPVNIGWLDETSAFVALQMTSSAASVMKTLCKKGSVYRIMTYKDFKQQSNWVMSGNQSAFSVPQPPDNQHQSAPKRSHSPEDPNIQESKKAKTLNADAPVFESRITPNTTPEKGMEGVTDKDQGQRDQNVDQGNRQGGGRGGRGGRKHHHHHHNSGKKIVILKRPPAVTGRKKSFVVKDDDFPPLPTA